VRTNIPHITPPSGYDIEMRLLASLIHLGDPNNLRVQNAMLRIDVDCFNNMDHRILFELLEQLFAKGHKFDFVDFITLVQEEQYHLVTQAVKDDYMFPHHLEHDVEKLIAYKLLRKQLRILVDTINLSLDEKLPEDSLEVIRDQIQLLSKTTTATNASIVRTYETIADEFLAEELDDNNEIPVDIPNLPPVPNNSLITIAGRSGHGKTFFALYLMDKLIDALPNRQSLYFNLEMHERVMMERHAKLLGIHGNTRKETIRNGLGKLLAKNVSLISQPMITIDQIETECRLASIKQPIAVIVVDYLGLITSKTRSERKDLDQSNIAKRLAALSLDLNCVVILLSQVNREFKNRPIGDRCPLTQDAAESMGSVHSSSWWLGVDQPQSDTDDPEWQDMFFVACRKNRGDSGFFKLQLKFKNGMFSKWLRPFCRPNANKNLEHTTEF
jgi:replicative DNA helicase